MLRTATLMGGVPGLANLMEQYTRLSHTHRLATVMYFSPAALAIGIWLAAVTLPVAQLTVRLAGSAVMIGGQFQSPQMAQRFPRLLWGKWCSCYLYDPLCRRVIRVILSGVD